MHYDVIIIGAGMSGLAAGIRLAYYDKSVCILERHYAFGGLNSYYRMGSRDFDVGLHAVTNFTSPERRSGPLAKLLRQLRFTREDFDLRPQHHSEVRFPGKRLRFTNDIKVLENEVAESFPGEVDNFRQLRAVVESYDDARLDQAYRPTRPVLRDALGDPLLIEMLLCPLMFYGSAEEHDMDFTQFVTMFKSIFCEGMARPPGGVRTIIRALVRKFRSYGGEFRMRCPVRRLELDGRRVVGVTMESGETLTADAVISSAGYHETMQLCGAGRPAGDSGPGVISFVESIAILDTFPAALGHDATIIFYCDTERFTYARPVEPVDFSSGIVCCPNNYEGHEGLSEGVFRLTWLADHGVWMAASPEDYAALKRSCFERFLEQSERFVPGLRRHVVASDVFTPRTIHYYTGHLNGAVYGAPRKYRDGRTSFENLFICGTDQGYLGIVGAMLSGITVANLHVLAQAS